MELMEQHRLREPSDQMITASAANPLRKLATRFRRASIIKIDPTTQTRSFSLGGQENGGSEGQHAAAPLPLQSGSISPINSKRPVANAAPVKSISLPLQRNDLSSVGSGSLEGEESPRAVGQHHQQPRQEHQQRNEETDVGDAKGEEDTFVDDPRPTKTTAKKCPWLSAASSLASKNSGTATPKDGQPAPPSPYPNPLHYPPPPPSNPPASSNNYQPAPVSSCPTSLHCPPPSNPPSSSSNSCPHLFPFLHSQSVTLTLIEELRLIRTEIVTETTDLTTKMVEIDRRLDATIDALEQRLNHQASIRQNLHHQHHQMCPQEAVQSISDAASDIASVAASVPAPSAACASVSFPVSVSAPSSVAVLVSGISSASIGVPHAEEILRRESSEAPTSVDNESTGLRGSPVTTELNDPEGVSTKQITDQLYSDDTGRSGAEEDRIALIRDDIDLL